MRDVRGGWADVRAAFHEALDQPPAERAAYVERRLGGDPDAVAEVRELLESHAAADGFLETAEGAAAWLGRRIGPYRCIAELGRGGMGSVFLALRDDGEFHQRVAIKVLKRGMDTDEVVRRFRAERQALAALDHPLIARVLDGGTTDDGLPYLVMEAIDGEPIDVYCRERALPRRARLELFLEVCRAVSHAHQLLIVHRDLKPSNVLVSESDGAPVPKLLDFGLAKLLSPDGTAEDVTAALGQAAWMTPAYASPEQLRGVPVGTTTDVYSLGALLYRLVAGRTPFDAGEVSAAALLGTAGERVPPPIDRRRGDLDTIVQKALAPDPARRYASVERLADDVRRLLDGLPIEARPSTFAYRARKFLRRHSVAAASIGGAFVVLVAALTAVLVQVREAREQAAAREDVSEFLGRLLTSVDPVNEGRDVDFLQVVERAAERVDVEFGGRPRVRASLKDKLGQAFHRLGRYDEARALLEESLATRRALDGDDDEEVAEALDHLADLLIDLEEFDAAGPLLVESLARREAAGDPVALAATHNLVGLWHYWTNDLDAGERHIRRALTLQRGHLGDASEAAALSHNNLALIHQERGDGGAAIECLKRSVEIQRRLYERPHPNLATGLYNLGWLSYHRTRIGEARRALEKAVSLRRELFGERHLDTALAVGTLGGVLLDLGDYERSEPLLREAHRVMSELVSRESFHFANASFGLGKLFEATGAFAAAADAYAESLTVYRRWGETNTSASLAATREIACLVAGGEHDVARARIAAFLETMADGAGAYRNAGHVGEVLAARARMLVDRGEREAAEATLAEALAIPAGAWSWRRVWALELESELARDRGELHRARAALEDAVAWIDRNLAGGVVVKSWLRHALGRLVWRSGQRSDAVPVLRAAGGELARRLPAGHPWLAIVDEWARRTDDA